MATFSECASFQVHRLSIDTLCYSPDGRRLASAGRDLSIRIWNTADWQPIHGTNTHIDEVEALRFSVDCARVTTVAMDRTMRQWDTQDGRHLRHIHTDMNRVWPCCVFSGDGRFVAWKGNGQVISIWDVTTFAKWVELVVGEGEIGAIAFSPDCQSMAAALPNELRLWNLVEREAVPRTRGVPGLARCLAFSPDESYIALGDFDGKVTLVSLTGDEEMCFVHGQEGCMISSLAFSQAAGCLASAGGESICLWDLSKGENTCRLLDNSFSICFAHCGPVIACGGRDGAVRLRDIRTGEILKVMRGHMGEIRAVAYSPDDTLIATGSTDGTVLIWKV